MAFCLLCPLRVTIAHLIDRTAAVEQLLLNSIFISVLFFFATVVRRTEANVRTGIYMKIASWNLIWSDVIVIATAKKKEINAIL